MGCKLKKKNILNPNLRFPFIVAHRRYRQNIPKIPVDRKDTLLSVRYNSKLLSKP